ncbi:MAG: hypothetical protein V2I43_20885 [Parvularcula sp.]|jgi:hypothetical protein|nr:hypothetical protein [Parvularcula sp.]
MAESKDDKAREKDERLDEGLDESFPASDPPAAVREPQPTEEDKKQG